MSRISPDEVILGLLAQHTSHGYQLLEHFREETALGQIWSLSTSQLYSILKRLEHREEIDGREFFPDDAPPRTEYWLTAAGRQRFEAWLHDPSPSASTRRIRTEFLSRLYLARLVSVPTAPIIAAQRRACLAQRDMLIARAGSSENPIYALAVDLVIAEMSTILGWLDHCTARLASAHSIGD